MLGLTLLKVYLVLQYSICINFAYEAFGEQDEASYLESFDTLIKDSYSAPLPNDLKAECKAANLATPVTIKTITSSMSSARFQEFCGYDSICTIPAGFTVTMSSNLNVAALIVKGNLVWNDENQFSNTQWLCAGYIAVVGGTFDMNLVDKTGFIYIKNNGLKDDAIKTRAFGAYGAGKIQVTGRSLSRTWSLLAEKAIYGMDTISLLHNPQQMGWRVGDRIVIAPTVHGSNGNAEDFSIRGFDINNSIKLLNRDGTDIGQITSSFESKSLVTGNNMSALMQAEVINLSRNIIITGDDFEHVQCVQDTTGTPPDSVHFDHCSCWNSIKRTKCTLGLHTVAMGVGSVLSLKYTRVEKCGQRGILGKYCIHFHMNQKCQDCKAVGNAVEYGHHRGTIIHGTHLSTVEMNVYNDIRGGIIYVEDGNEMYNRIFHNVVICPWAKSGEKRGCTIPGTDNGQADTTLNQAGLWGLSFTNYAIGNRFANNYNGMLYQEQGLASGRGPTSGMLCANLQQIGRLEGNTFHGCGRFGTYVLASVFPKKIQRTVSMNGIVNLTTCTEWTSTGEDTGLPATFMQNVDYGNVFVGQYGAGDLQYRFHTSINNNNLIYWKDTKNFQDGCSAHIADSYYENGNLALPGGHGTFLLENMIFNNQIHFESSHHCNSGVTWTGTISSTSRIVQWGPNNGAMFTLGPDDENNRNGNNLFPAGFCSIVNPYWSYLLAIDNGATCFTLSDVADLMGQNVLNFASRYDKGAIFCKRPVRRLEIFSFDQTPVNNRNMNLELWQSGKLISSVVLKYFQIGDTRKQGYSVTVIPGLDHQYRLSMADGSNVPNDWIIEFSDTIFGNRWKRDEINLLVAGRNCPSPVHSQHDRRFIWSGENYLKVRGRGACTAYPDMPTINCKNEPELSNIENCPNKCEKKCTNGYCDCETGECLCSPGFSGANCLTDTCTAAGCVNGHCAAKYLGGDLLVTNKPCVCLDGWYGDKCDSRIPPIAPEYIPICHNGCFFYPDTDISGGNLQTLGTSDIKTCCAACTANSACQSWVIFGGTCYLKNGNQRVYKAGCLGGIKCTSGEIATNLPTSLPTNSPTVVTVPESSTVCTNGCYYYSNYDVIGADVQTILTSNQATCCAACNDNPICNSWVVFGSYCYLKTGTERVYKSGCNSGIKCLPENNTSSQTNAPTTAITTTADACFGFCKGNYPFGCNTSFTHGYCNSGGGCYYTPTDSASWCCFKGC